MRVSIPRSAAIVALLAGCLAPLPPGHFTTLDVGRPRQSPGYVFTVVGTGDSIQNRIRRGIEKRRLFVGAEQPGWIHAYGVGLSYCEGLLGTDVCSVFWVVTYKTSGDSTLVSVSAYEHLAGRVNAVDSEGFTDATRTKVVTSDRVVIPGSKNWGSIEKLARAISGAK